jgi:hypothetical protein
MVTLSMQPLQTGSLYQIHNFQKRSAALLFYKMIIYLTLLSSILHNSLFQLATNLLFKVVFNDFLHLSKLLSMSNFSIILYTQELQEEPFFLSISSDVASAADVDSCHVSSGHE